MTTMFAPMPAVLTFLSPLWAIGVAAALGLPVLVHLLSRTRYRPVDFPATRFVERAVLETQQVNHPRHRLLMLLRMLALMAVVAAFMQPRWDLAAAGSPGQRGECLVLIVDASASMQRSERGETLFSHARRQALERLDALDPGRDRAVVVLAGRTPRSLLREPSGNFTLLRERLQEARCTYESADLAGAVALADELLAEQPRAGRIIVLSDGQASNRPAAELAAERTGLGVDEWRVGGGSAGNLAVRLVEVSPYPPVAGVPMALTVELRSFGGEPTDVVLHAEGGAAPMSRRVTLAAGATATQTLSLIPEAGGDTAGPAVFRVRLDAADDGFPFDNETGLVSPVAEARRVLLFTDSSPSRDTAASRLVLALTPRADDARPADPMAAALPLRIGQFQPDDLPQRDDASECWIVTGLAQPPPAAFLNALQQHLRAGGGVVWLMDTPASRGVLAEMDESPLQPTGGAVSDAVLASARFEHPVLSVFEGPSRAALVGVRLAGVAEAQPADSAAVLLRAADGRPVLASCKVGRGQLMVFNADLSPGRSVFASQPGFVPLMSELVRYAAPGPAVPPPARPGEPISEALRAAGDVLNHPADADASAVDHFTAPGAYVALTGNGEPVAGRWVELDPAESDFTQAPTSGEVDSGGVVMQAAGPAGADRPRMVELWPYLIACGLLLAGAESLLLIFFARRGGGA